MSYMKSVWVLVPDKWGELDIPLKKVQLDPKDTV
jgi:hypothetical protein